MAYQDELLFRDSLLDDGSEPSHGGYCSSPDIICHKQMTDPQTELVSTYAQDINQCVELGSKTNFVYTRTKNTNSSAQEGYVRLYRASASLFMTPSLWRNNPMKTPEGDSYVKMNALGNGIAVGERPFLLDATASNRFCLVGIVNSDTTETVPGDFSTYNAFVVWVHQYRAVCVRNLNVINTTKTSFEQLDNLKNPENTPRRGAFFLTAYNVPVGATIGMQCGPIGLDESKRVASSKEELNVAISGVPAHFNGYVRTYAILPPSHPSWPDDARIEVDYYVEMAASMRSFQWGVPPQEMLSANDAGVFSAGHRLVKVGSCGTVFKSA